MSRLIACGRRAPGLLSVLALALLAACGTPQQPPGAGAPMLAAPPGAVAPAGGQVLGRGEWFIVYQPGAGETLRSVAAHYLGSPERYWMIADFNGVSRADPGRPLVLPLKSPNPIGVHADEYQTVPILAYHRFGAAGGRMVVSPSSFAAQLEWLARNDYRVIPLAQLAGYLAGKQTLPRRAVVITIDDGYESAHRHALPLLRKHGFPATLFVYTDFVGGGGESLSWQQLHELASSGLVDIQAHSKSHRNLLERSPAESDQQYRHGLEQEVRAPREILERRLPVQVRHFAFPYGDANDIVLDLLGRQQYQLAVTVNPGGNPFFAQPFMLRRTMRSGPACRPAAPSPDRPAPAMGWRARRAA
jgi:peptidoglycan/xylan/chitin deacetylase (PgdA/CDA1 family)